MDGGHCQSERDGFAGDGRGSLSIALDYSKLAFVFGRFCSSQKRTRAAKR